MPASSNSVSSTPLPFGADNHTTLSRSGSVPRSVHHEYQAANHDRVPQTYADLIDDAQHSIMLTRLPNVQIPPSSIKSIPRSHKKVLREHCILFRVLIVIFLLSLMASTAAVVLGAFTAHQYGQNGVKCAATIVGVFGFSGTVGSAAVMWLILTGRKERARLEKRWADEEKVKEAVSRRGRRTESQLRAIIKDRERSLSRSRSRGRDRDRDRALRPAGARIRSFRSFELMTPTPTPSSWMPDHGVQGRSRRARSPWPRARDVTDDVDDDSEDGLDRKVDKEKDYEKDVRYNGAGGNQKDEERDVEKSKHNGKGDKEDAEERDYEKDGIYIDNRKNHGSHEQEDMALAAKDARVSASTQFQDLDSIYSAGDDDTKTEMASPPNMIMLQPKVLSKASLPLDVYKPLPAIPDPDYTSPAPRNFTSPYVSSSLSDLYSGVLEPFHSSTNPLFQHAPSNTDIACSNRLRTRRARSDDDSPPDVIRWTNRGLGSSQSDDNFEAMLDLADDAGSEDERDRQLRKQRSLATVTKWASAVSLEAEAEGAEREEKGRGLMDALQKGIRRVASKKKERRKETVGYI